MTAQAPIPEKKGLIAARVSRPRWWVIRGEMSGRTSAVLAAVGLIAPFLAWWVYTLLGFADPLFMPGPGAVAERFVHWWTDEGLLNDTAISVYRVMVGFLISALIALPLGLYLGTYRPVQATLEPLIDFIRYMPAVAFIPLVMLWVGIGESSKILIIFIGTFFQMALMAVRHCSIRCV